MTTPAPVVVEQPVVVEPSTKPVVADGTTGAPSVVDANMEKKTGGALAFSELKGGQHQQNQDYQHDELPVGGRRRRQNSKKKSQHKKKHGGSKKHQNKSKKHQNKNKKQNGGK